MTIILELDRRMRAAGLAIVGVSIGDGANKATWAVQWLGVPTSPETTQAAAIITAFDIAAFNLAEARLVKVAAVDLELRNRNRAGFTHGGSVFRLDDGAVAAIAVIQAAAPWPGGVGYFAADDTPVAFTGAQFATFAHAVAVKALERLAHARGLRVAIAAAASQAALDLIDVTAGWP